MDAALTRFLETYQRLDKHNLASLGDIYAKGVLFEDPAHRLQGLAALQGYFASLYENVSAVQFAYAAPWLNGEKAQVQWTMTLTHPRLAGGRPVAVEGVSVLRFDGTGKVDHHRDYFDLGAMLYEQLPLLGPVVKAVKRRLAS